ncbi:hypothetical protein HDU86_004654 [Geranomyces michiganensis]|nr:hypothetical protein HDU86_004654 [Geranomyces michiganensis]
MPLEIIGAGFGRTGTKSTQIALEHLGFKTYHMSEVFAHMDHIKTWEAASRGEPVDWEAFLGEYRATVDWPGCDHWRQMLERYPKAKVLLNVRDADKWYESVSESIYRITNLPEEITSKVPQMQATSSFVKNTIWGPNGVFKGRFLDKEFAKQVFADHIAEVKRAVPPEQLLVFEVSEGWEPLCKFLGVPVPQDMPFPRTNEKAEFQARIEALKRGELLARPGEKPTPSQ